MEHPKAKNRTTLCIMTIKLVSSAGVKSSDDVLGPEKWTKQRIYPMDKTYQDPTSST